MSTTKHIIGLNTLFDDIEYEGYTDESFNSAVSLLDYDAVIIDTDDIINMYRSSGISEKTVKNKVLLSESASYQIVEDYDRIKMQLTEMLEQGKNIYVQIGNNDNCYLSLEHPRVEGTGVKTHIKTSEEFDMYSFLPIGLAATSLKGSAIQYSCPEPYHTFFEKTSSFTHYVAYYSTETRGITLGQIKNSDKVVSSVISYGKGRIIILPGLVYDEQDDWGSIAHTYLDSIFELNDKLSITDNDYQLPEWSKSFHVFNEAALSSDILNIEARISALSLEIDKKNAELIEIRKYKRLLTSSGDILEDIVKQVLDELGFLILETERGRSDIIAKYNEYDVVAEVKGLTKSAGERNAAQLEKWASIFYDKNDRKAKAMLIVNGYCDLPIDERTESVFPDQMISYSIAREHCLLSTTQLFCLFIDVSKNPECKEERINELLSTIGVYDRYKNPFDYIEKVEKED